MEFLPGAFEHEWERRRAALLHERSLGRGKPLNEEERRRRGGTVPTASPLPAGAANRFGFAQRAGSFARDRGQGAAFEPSMRSRFAALASGSQPAVVKMASFGGGGRLGAMINYVSRNGEVTVENERGEHLRGRDELSAVRGEWDHLLKNRAESRDIGIFSIEIKEPFDPVADVYQQARALLKRGLGDRSFAFAVTPRSDGNGDRIEGVAVLRDQQGERLSGDEKASVIVRRRLDGDRSEREDRGMFRFIGYGNGTEYGARRLRDLVERHHGAVQDDKGGAITDAKQAGDLIQLDWRDRLHSRKPRDVMHVIMSARAGTDAQAFHAAAGAFLAQEFAGHRYVFSLHDPSRDPKAAEVGGKRPHVHVHAIVAMRSDAGDRLETSIPAFRRWRVTIAEKARAQGLHMEMTDRRERASSAAYHRNQVRPTSHAGRTQHEGTSAAAQRRYDAKRSDGQSYATTEDSRIYSITARREWASIAAHRHAGEGRAFAEDQIKRLDSVVSHNSGRQHQSSEPKSSLSHYRTNLVKFMETFSEGETMRQMTRQEFEAYEKRVETALFQAERVMPANERANFDAIASAAREHVNVRRELMELQQQNGERTASSEPEGQGRDDDAKARWDEAVARHGLRTVEAANKIMLEVEHYREAIELADADEINGNKASLQASLNLELTRAGELGAAGNTLIREIAEADEELHVAVERAQQLRDDRNKTKAGGEDGFEMRVNGEDDASRDEGFNRRPAEAEQVQVVGDPDQQRAQRVAARPGDTNRTDPAQQHSPRLEQLQHEADEKREQGRDERER